jgi:hypothetical protein
MKYTRESLELKFDLYIKASSNYVYIWRHSDACRPINQMFCCTFDLDFDSELNTTDIEKIQKYLGDYFNENDVAKLQVPDSDKVFRVDLFLALTNSPKCPYKIIGVSERFVNCECITTYHFMIKHDILSNTKTIVI